MKFDVITIGAAVRDVYIHSDAFTIEDRDTNTTPEACFVLGGKIEIGAPHFSSGGGATNAAASFAHLGRKVACIAKIGEDDAGKDIERDLHYHGVYTNLLVRSRTEQTGYSTLLTTANGQRTALVYRGAAATLTAKEVPWDKLRSRWLYVSSLGGDLRLLKRIFAHAADHDIHVAWNPGSAELKLGNAKLAPLLKHTTILSLNRDEAAYLTHLPPSDLRSIITRLQETTGRYLVITDGKHGTYASDGEHTYLAKPTDVPVVNVTGAGDAFGAAFTVGIITYRDPIMALRLGTLNAEAVIQTVGAKQGILTRLPGSRRLGQIVVEPYTR